MHADEPALRTRELTKSYGPVRALRNVTATFFRGRITALLGENGAGKSTLIKCLTGVVRPDSGDVVLHGRAARFSTPRDAEAMGISTVHQEIGLIPHMTVAENISLGREPLNRLGFIRRREVRSRALRAIARVGIAIDPDRELHACSTAEQQLVAVARALDVDASVLILDEPTSSLDRPEVQRLFAVLRTLRDRGLAVIVVTHFLDQVFELADDVTVLRDGQLVAERPAASLTRSSLVWLMLGRDANTSHHHASASPQKGTTLLEARDMRHPGSIEGVSLVIRSGEILGLAGLLGSGRTETARAIFSHPAPHRGDRRWMGRPLNARTPRHSVKLGMTMTPEDRRDAGVFPSLSVADNIAITLLTRVGKAPGDLAQRFIARLGIKCGSSDAPLSSLSGGNQQKALLARCLAAEPKLLITDEPTRGIDIGAKADVLRVLAELRDQGVAVLLVSSDLDELASACDRVTVLRDRASVAELSAPNILPQSMLRAISESPASAQTD
ncbi:MAG: sugar ABC transporter ATP-binding protein [Phycisphaerales bacterium]